MVGIWRPAHGPRDKNGHHQGDEYGIGSTMGPPVCTLRALRWLRLQQGLHSGRSRRVLHSGPVGVVDRQVRTRAPGPCARSATLVSMLSVKAYITAR